MYEEIPDWLSKLYNKWKTVRDGFIDNRGKPAEDYFYNDKEGTGTPYTRQQLNTIISTTNIPVSFNYIYPAVEQKLAITTSSKPSFKLVPIDNRAKPHAQVLDKVKYHVLYNSDANSQVKEMQKDTLIMGLGHIECVETSFYQPGEFNTAVVYRHPQNIILDPNSRNRNNEDMRGYWFDCHITREMAEQLYSEILEYISNVRGEKITMDVFEKVGSEKYLDIATTEEKTVWLRQFNDKVMTTKYFIKDPEQGILHTFQENYDPDAWDLLIGENGENIVDTETNIYVRRWTVLGTKVILQQILNYTVYPLRTNYYIWGGMPYRSYGMVHWIYSPQEAHDKLLQLFVLNGILTNNPKRKAPVGWATPEIKKKWEDGGNDPRVVNEYIPIVLEGKILVPEYEPVPQLSNFYPLLLDGSKAAIEYSTGINPMVYGDPTQGKVDVFSALQKYQEAAMQRIAMCIADLNNTLMYLGTAVMESIIANLRPEINYVFFDDKAKMNELEVAMDIVSDIKLGKYKIISVPTEAMPSQRTAMSTELMKIAQTTPDPMKRDIYIEGAFDLADMRGFDELKEKTEVVQQMQQQVQSSQEELERMTELYKQVENRMLVAQANETRAKRETDIQVKAAEAIKDIEIAKLKDMLQDAKRDKKDTEK